MKWYLVFSCYNPEICDEKYLTMSMQKSTIGFNFGFNLLQNLAGYQLIANFRAIFESSYGSELKINIL